MEEAKETGDEAEEAEENREENKDARASDETLDLDDDPENEDKDEDESSSEEDEDEDSSTDKSSDEDGQDTSKKPDKATQELVEKNKKLFARAKKAEEKFKKYEGKKDDKKGDAISSADPIELAKTIAALKDFSSDELDYVKLIATGKGITLDEAVETDEVKTYIGAKREKVEGENKTPTPSSPSSVLGGKTEEEVEKMDSKKFAKWFKKETKGKRIGV